jgi:lipopolysaccharide transport protein LptA
MKRVIIAIFLILPLSIYAKTQQVQIQADSFEASEKDRVSYFIGAVSIKKGSDNIKANKLKIKFDANNKPIHYIATGDLEFDIKTDNQHFIGSAQMLTYKPSSKIYTIQGNVNIVETTKNRTLEGEKITLDTQSSQSKIVGDKNTPVKFTFTVEE